jgi:hypothetical protein
LARFLACRRAVPAARSKCRATKSAAAVTLGVTASARKMLVPARP